MRCGTARRSAAPHVCAPTRRRASHGPVCHRNAVQRIRWNGQISTSRGFETPEWTSIKLGTYDITTLGIITPANTDGAKTTWVGGHGKHATRHMFRFLSIAYIFLLAQSPKPWTDFDYLQYQDPHESASQTACFYSSRLCLTHGQTDRQTHTHTHQATSDICQQQ